MSIYEIEKYESILFFDRLNMKIIRICGLFVIGAIHSLQASKIDFNTPCSVSSLQIGATYTRANIRIDGQPSFNGNLGGIEGSYEYKPCNSLYGGLKLSWKQGKTDSSFAERKLTYVDVQERIGYTCASFFKDWSTTFFSGFGYRYLGHNLKLFEIPSIKFNYNEFYVPVGFLSQYFFSHCWSLGLNFTWMPQVYPTVEIVPLKGARWMLKNTMDNVLVELPLTYKFTKYKCYSLVFKPFYERWNDGRSTAETISGEELGLPKNSYNFYGAELQFVFQF